MAVNMPARLTRAVNTPQNIPKKTIAGDPITVSYTHLTLPTTPYV